MAKAKSNTASQPQTQDQGGNTGAQKTPEKDKPTIEELAVGVDPAIFAGVCVRMKWRAGKRVSAEEFGKAVEAFGKSSISGGAPQAEEPKKEEQEASE